MFASNHELMEKIQLGEDGFLELKEVRFAGGKVKGPQQNDLADELAAFANTRGGVLVLGVEDVTREVLGIPEGQLDTVEALVRQACEDSIKPPIAPMIERIQLMDSLGNKHPVIRIDVPRGLFVHKSPGGYMHRVGSSKREMPYEQLMRLDRQRSQSRLIRYDETPVGNATLADLDEKLWQRFSTPRTMDTPEQFLSKLAIISKDDSGEWHPTLAGLLLACPNPQQFIPNAFIQAVAYRGVDVVPPTDGLYQIDARDITGPLDQQIFGACDFVQKNMRVAARKLAKGGRQDLPQFDMLAVFEAITNAVAHRDYSMYSGKVRLRLFADRLELYTPGMLVNTMTPESLPYRQAVRNEAVASLLARCPVEWEDYLGHREFIMEKRGEGVPIILDHSERLSGKAPKYSQPDESELLLTIYAADPEDVWGTPA